MPQYGVQGNIHFCEKLGLGLRMCYERFAGGGTEPLRLLVLRFGRVVYEVEAPTCCWNEGATGVGSESDF